MDGLYLDFSILQSYLQFRTCICERKFSHNFFVRQNKSLATRCCLRQTAGSYKTNPQPFHNKKQNNISEYFKKICAEH